MACAPQTRSIPMAEHRWDVKDVVASSPHGTRCVHCRTKWYSLDNWKGQPAILPPKDQKLKLPAILCVECLNNFVLPQDISCIIAYYEVLHGITSAQIAGLRTYLQKRATEKRPLYAVYL